MDAAQTPSKPLQATVHQCHPTKVTAASLSNPTPSTAASVALEQMHRTQEPKPSPLSSPCCNDPSVRALGLLLAWSHLMMSIEWITQVFQPLLLIWGAL
jgi:hypothetical protein